MVLAGRALCLSSDGLLLPKTETNKKKLKRNCIICVRYVDFMKTILLASLVAVLVHMQIQKNFIILGKCIT